MADETMLLEETNPDDAAMGCNGLGVMLLHRYKVAKPSWKIFAEEHFLSCLPLPSPASNR